MIMIDVQPVDRAGFKRHLAVAEARGTESDMAQEPEDADMAADRLEAALERIAALTAVRTVPSPAPDTELSIPEIAERLDSLIGRLRAALGKPDALGKPE
jgi:hypothetical protein